MERPDILNKIIKQLKRYEDFRLGAYLDSKGILTVGIGHNCIARPVPGVFAPGCKITEQEAFDLLMADIDMAESEMLRRWPWIRELDDARYAVLLNMSFNMGIGKLSEFRNTFRFIHEGDYRQGAINMLKSRWAKQVGDFPPGSPKAIRTGRPGRAWELAEQMCTGKWQGVEG